MRVTLSLVPNVHEVLFWANRRAVAREITERGYRVSGETLNRWVRDQSEVPAIVERIVFELFGIGQQETAPPWAERLEQKIDLVVSNQGVVADEALRKLVSVLAPPGRVADVESIAAELRRKPPRSGAAPDDPLDTEDRGTSQPTGQGSA